jgi:Ca-activated chloride channel family protein
MKTRHALLLALVAVTVYGCSFHEGRSGPHNSTLPPLNRFRSYDLRSQSFHTLALVPGLDRFTLAGIPTVGDASRLELLVIEEEKKRSDIDAPRVEPPRGGELRAKVAEKTVPLPLKHTDVKAQVTVYVGAVTVTQKYHNPYDGKIEAVYVFPLPDDAAVRDFVMQIGERQIRGIVREREEAQKIYHEARAQGYVASLLTQDRPNIFTQAVANIEPGKEIDIRITYFHTLRYADGVFEFVFPMVVGPRYNPAGFADGVGAVPAGAPGSSGQKTEVQYLRPEEISAHDIALEVLVDAGVAIDEVKSPSHAIAVERPNPMQAKVTLSPHDRIPNKDFILRYRAPGRTIRSALATHQDETGGYFTLMVHPPEKLADVPRTPREMIFVIDCSGSMSGQPLDAARRAMERCLQRLAPEDTFTVIRFGSHASHFSPVPLAATPENVRAGLRFVESLQANGGTEMIPAVRLALSTPNEAGRYRIVSFMTDGFVGNDREVIAEVRRRLGPARLFSFGVGSAPNRYLIEGMARAGRAVAAYVLLDESSERAASELYERVERPAFTDLRIDWGGMEVADVHPNPLPDLYVGRPVVLTGRFKGSGRAEVRISGKIGGKPHESTLAVDLDQPDLRHKALGAVWARGKIASLYDAATWAPDPRELTGEIKAVALKYGLMSDWTSFVAVDSTAKTAGDHGTTVVQPVPVPKGVRYDTTVGEKK